MKTKRYLYYFTIFLFLVSFIALILISYDKVCVKTSTTQMNMPKSKIIIDAGHGGEDGGAVSGEVIEKDINLDITRKLSDIFTVLGYDVTETRKEDISIYTNGETIKQKKVSDMKNRLAIFNSDENNVVISIHQNKFTESKYYGTQIFYSANNENSIILAENIRKSITNLLQPDNTRELKKADKNIYLLNKATVPAIIVECGFISNSEECNKLLTNQYQTELAYSIALGYINFNNQNY